MLIGIGVMYFTSGPMSITTTLTVLLFFEELNYGWYQMYADDEFWGRSEMGLS
jgi:hypothetical protein